MQTAQTADQSREMSWFGRSVSVKCFAHWLWFGKRQKKKTPQASVQMFFFSEFCCFHKICNAIFFKMRIKMLFVNAANGCARENGCCGGMFGSPWLMGFWVKHTYRWRVLTPPSTPPRTTCGISGCSNYEKMTVSGKLKRQDLNAPSKKPKKTHMDDSTDGTPCFFYCPNTLFWIWPLTCLKGRSYKKKRKSSAGFNKWHLLSSQENPHI